MKIHHRSFAAIASLASSLLIGCFLTGCSTTAVPPSLAPLSAHDVPASGRREIAALFDRWNRSLATLDPDKVLAHYAPDAILLPTLSNQPRTNHAELRDYFAVFLARKPQGKIDQRTIRIEGSTAWDAGIYTFTLHGVDGKVTKAQARFTFIYKRQPGGGWLIALHHSSLMPEPIVKPE